MPRPKLKNIISALTSFSPREQRGVLLLIPLLAAVSIIFFRLRQPSIDESFIKYGDEVMRGSENSHDIPRADKITNNTYGKDINNGTAESPKRNANSQKQAAGPFEFDPNTIDLTGLVRLGFSEKQAQGIINYRNAGAVFRRRSDFARCYTVSETMFKRLAPYIRISPDKAAGNNAENSPKQNTVPYKKADEDSPPQQTAGSQYKTDSQPTVRTSALKNEPEPAAENRNTQNAAANSQRHFPIELNGADSASLVSVRGIGPLTASRIMRYRDLLGGYASVAQLGEIVGMTDENYAMILQQIYVDSGVITKIDINFATPQQMKGHPYIPPRTIDKISKQRQLKGGWRTIDELVRENILTQQQAARLAPYLRFSEL